MLAVKKSVMLLHCTCSYTLNAILPFSLLGESFNEGKFIMLELQLWLSYVQKREKKNISVQEITIYCIMSNFPHVKGFPRPPHINEARYVSPTYCNVYETMFHKRVTEE